MSASDLHYIVRDWGGVMDAISITSTEPEYAKRIIARVMSDPDNAIAAVAALCDLIRADIERTHRARAVKRMMWTT